MDTIAKGEDRKVDLNRISQPLIISFAHRQKEDKSYLLLKRGFDIAIASIVICTILSWLYPLLFILINSSSKGGTLFIQKRIGLHGKIFNCYKFRSMVINSEADQREATANDKRITKIGRWLRMSYIDELPQLFNVLVGDMSIIGPRPHMLYHHTKFCAEIPYYNNRHGAKPGITGLSQIKGFHGSVSDPYRIYARTKLDLFYVQNASLRLDTMIFIKTIPLFFSSNKIKKI